MNIDDSDLLPVGGGNLRASADPPVRQQVATFTPTRSQHPNEIWPAFGRMNDMTRNGSQGLPFGSYRPGRPLEHEPVDRSERDAEHTAQSAFHAVAAGQVRTALRGGI
jgi:hypothetical protein